MFFDVDGTLVDTNYLHTFAWWRALDDAGERRPMAHLHRLIGMGGTEVLTTLLGHDDDEISAAQSGYFSELDGFVSALPGADDLISRVSDRGAMVVIVTSANQKGLTSALNTLGARDRIDLIISGEDAERAKPHPDLFSIALQRADVPAASVLALGDAVWDVKAAAKVGIGCTAVETGGFSEGELRDAGALAVYRSCTDLLAHWNESPLARLLD